MESLRAREDASTGACARGNLFRRGATVEFRAGPLSGLEGIFDIEAGDGRVLRTPEPSVLEKK